MSVTSERLTNVDDKDSLHVVLFPTQTQRDCVCVFAKTFNIDRLC